MFPLTCPFFHKTHNQNSQKSLVNPLLTEFFSTAERQFRCGSVLQRVTHFVPTVQGNGGTPIFALKWVCRTDTSVELP